MPVWEAIENKSLKLSKVGLLTKNLGGNKNNSSSGLKAWLKIYKIGSTINSATGSRRIKNLIWLPTKNLL